MIADINGDLWIEVELSQSSMTSYEHVEQFALSATVVSGDFDAEFEVAGLVIAYLVDARMERRGVASALDEVSSGVLEFGLEAFDHDPFGSEFVLIIESVTVEEKFRGHGAGRIMLDALLEALGKGRSCTAILFPQPLDWEVLESPVLRRGQRKLEQYWGSLGFRKLRVGSRSMVRNASC